MTAAKAVFRFSGETVPGRLDFASAVTPGLAL